MIWKLSRSVKYSILFYTTLCLVGYGYAYKDAIHLTHTLKSIQHPPAPSPRHNTKFKKQQKKSKGNLQSFMNKIAHVESTNNQHIISDNGMLGKYQFSKTTLTQLAGDITVEEFLADAELQDSIMIANIRVNYNILRKYIRQYTGMFKNDVYITPSGLLAGAHLMGAGGVISWLKSDSTHAHQDSKGTHIEKYVKLFAGYNISEALN